MFLNILEKATDWDEFRLIVPCVSVGNVGQLTADLLICNLCMEKVGYIYHESILPLIGNDPFMSSTSHTCTFATSCEVYENTCKKIVVIQQRTPFVKGKQSQFISWLSDWIKSNKFKDIILLSSSYSSERLDKQIIGSQMRYLSSQSMENRHGVMFRDTLHWQKLEKRETFPASSALENGASDNCNASVYIPGGGMAKKFFEQNQSDQSLLLLIKFCEDGDNTHDALQMVTHFNSWLNLDDKNSWTIPSSWKLTFGHRPDQTLFH